MSRICTKCDICVANNSTPLMGDGNTDADIMFISRSPSYQDRKHNIPLVDKYGLQFQKFLDLFNFSRDKVYITHAVKCRTTNDRKPTSLEIANCHYLLDEELKLVNPSIVVLLGTTAVRSYFKIQDRNQSIPIESAYAIPFEHDGRIIIILPNPDLLGKEFYKLCMIIGFVKLAEVYKKINPFYKTNIR